MRNQPNNCSERDFITIRNDSMVQLMEGCETPAWSPMTGPSDKKKKKKLGHWCLAEKETEQPLLQEMEVSIHDQTMPVSVYTAD